MEIDITGDDVDLKDPPSRVRAMGMVAKMICQKVGADPADGVMILLTAAAWIAIEHAPDQEQVPDALADALGCAIIAAKEWSRELTKG